MIPSPDKCGHELLAQRLAQIPAVLEEMLARPPAPLTPAALASQNFIITGTGSSEAHARYLATLLNLHTDRAASYLPLSGFTASHRAAFAGKTLVAFSQGVSPNAQIALHRHQEFAHTILFSATTPEVAVAAGKPDRAALLLRLLAAGGELVTFPLAEEYTTLLRLVGPMAGYLACLQFAAQLPGCRFRVPPAAAIRPLLALEPPTGLLRAMTGQPADFARGFNLVCAAPISEFAQNLACKFMEGVFWPCPPISDFLQFAHGPFQQMSAHPHPVVILQGDSALEAELVQRSARMLAGAGLPAYVVHVTAPPLYSIFGFEAVFNRLVLALMARPGQLAWQGPRRPVLRLLAGYLTLAAPAVGVRPTQRLRNPPADLVEPRSRKAGYGIIRVDLSSSVVPTASVPCLNRSRNVSARRCATCAASASSPRKTWRTLSRRCAPPCSPPTCISRSPASSSNACRCRSPARRC
jgi:creatinine amidohydrolase